MKKVLNKKKILHFISHFPEIAQRERWVSDYDTDDDSLAIRTPKLSVDSRKRYISDDFDFYVNPKNEVEGVFIEYFVSNFVAHHGDFRKIAQGLRRERLKEKKGLIALNKNEVKKIVPELQEAIVNSLISDRSVKKAIS
ncbi:MAG: hypothetical protein ABSE18_04525 [Minisyncoccia bacterium]|jgi:hypothetical protein